MTRDTPRHAPAPLLELAGLIKTYPNGETEVRALEDVSLAIYPGEFVAIMGASGSGKSTLMHILGCLERPSGGAYRVAGRDVSALDPDALAALRRDTFGFVFQRYNLLPTATAAENVEIPAVYAGMPRAERAERARALLGRLGLADRCDYRPAQLSGGQQQRVSIARALMNGARVVLADEPTGALDSHSGAEVLDLLRGLHAGGRTIVLITHDAAVAAHAERIVQVSDGRIVEDSGPVVRTHTGQAPAPEPAAANPGEMLADMAEAVKMALRSLRANLFRTALTLLGIVIGVAAVVTMLAVGTGSKEMVLGQIEAMGTNLLLIRPGAVRSGNVATLVAGDAAAIAEIPNVVVAAPERSGSLTLRYGNTDYTTTVQGTWPGLTEARDWVLARGNFFTEEDVRSYAPVIVLGQTAVHNLFPDEPDALGRYVLVKSVPFEVIGVLASKGATPYGADMDDIAFVPLSTGLMRLFGRQHVGSITVKVADVRGIDATQAAVTDLLMRRHRTEDFRIRNMASVLETAEATQNTLTVLLGSVAAISLLVGGIGVMNIMLVSVTERTREIGIRMATGARMWNILLQFNTEAVVVCGIGGLLGIALGIAAAVVIASLGVPVVISSSPALLAFSCAFATGLLFGYLPARKAARLDPVVALASE